MSVASRTALALGLITALCITGFLYQAIALRWDTYQYPAPGKLVDVEGHKLHFTHGGYGLPSVVLEAGTGSFSLMWQQVPRDIAKFTHVFAYDRAGLGWSEESPLPRTAANMVRELHALLQNTHIPKPYILVGHSVGGGIALLYANTYPNEVFGLVLVDSGHEKIVEKIKEHHLAFERCMTGFTVVKTSSDGKHEQFPESFSQKLFLWLTNFPLGEKLTENLGLKRLYLKSFYEKAGCAQYPIYPALESRLLRPSTFRTTSQEIAHYGESSQQFTFSKDHLNKKPLIVISNGKGFFYNELCHQQMTPAEIEFNNQIWDPLQKDLVTKSIRAKQIIAKKSGHRIQDTEPELIVAAVKELVDEYHADSKIER